MSKNKVKQQASFGDYIDTVDGKSIIIEFDKIFGQPDIKYMNDLPLKKRSYYTISNLIIDSMRLIFNSCNEAEQAELALAYFLIVVNIKDSEKEYSFEDFKKDIINLSLNPLVRDKASNYVESNYEDEMDAKTEETKRTKKINQELQFTDEHVRILLKSAEAIRFVIPLITTYCEERDYNVTDGLYDCFYSVIDEYQGDIEIMNKIHRFVYSRVVSTQYSDRVIWNVLCNKTKDVNVISLEFLKDILIGILPKTVMDRNIINLFHVVIRNKIGFEFNRNYKISFKPINLNQVDSEGLTPFDKWEISMSKKNESKIIINRLSINQQLKNIRKSLGIKVTKDEFEYYKDEIKINRFQTNIIFLFFSKYLKSYQSLYNCDRDQYILMVIILYKWLCKNSYQYLTTYLIAKPDKFSEKRMTNKSKIYEQITESKAYKDLLEYKFKFISHNLEESNTIVKMIGNLSVSKFIETVPYEVYKERKDEEGSEELCKTVDISIQLIANDILEFLKLI